jgi:NAD-dependent dihydropyrimidine dehydrogenase PreA subunit
LCEFCVQHGDGKKWYLAMKNYSRELLEQDDRVEFMLDFANTFEARMPRNLAQLDALARTPLHGLAKPYLARNQKRDHFGQVVPLEEIEQILAQVDGIARLPCVCRRVTTGAKEARYCYVLTAHPRLVAELDDSFSLEYLSREQAIASVRALDKDGLVHSVWTFKTPYIGAVCNCDQDCIAYRISYSRGYFQNMFRSEYVAGVDRDACNGCKNCLRQCQFGAIRFSAVNKKVTIDPRQCYGCGVCRAACTKDAIALHARAADPIAARIW